MVNRALLINILTTAADRKGLMAGERAVLMTWGAKWAATFATDREYTPRAVMTMANNAAFAARNGQLDYSVNMRRGAARP